MDREPENDPLEQQDDPNGQLLGGDGGNGQGDGGKTDTTPTEYVEFEGVKVPASAFEKTARERYKDAFEAKENREKWQAENTRKAQENAEKLRKAELFDQLMAEGKFNQRQSQPTNPLEAQKQEYIREMKAEFPDVDERFFAKQFDWNIRLAESKGRELVEPIYAQSGEKFERDFLAAHPKVVKGSPEYQKIGQLIGAGVDAEVAYETVFKDDILKERLDKELQEAIKRRDEEAKRKLQQSRQSGASGTKPRSKNFDEHAWATIRRLQGAGN